MRKEFEYGFQRTGEWSLPLTIRSSLDYLLKAATPGGNPGTFGGWFRVLHDSFFNRADLKCRFVLPGKDFLFGS